MDDFSPSSQCAIKQPVPPPNSRKTKSLKATGCASSVSHDCCDCNIALIRIAFMRSKRKCCFSVLVQIKGTILLTPSSAAFSKNHSSLVLFFSKEIATVFCKAGLGTTDEPLTDTWHFFL